MRRLGEELGLLLDAAHPLLNLRVEKAFVLGTGSVVGRAHWTGKLVVEFGRLESQSSLQTRLNEFGDSSGLRVCRLDTTSLQTGPTQR